MQQVGHKKKFFFSNFKSTRMPNVCFRKVKFVVVFRKVKFDMMKKKIK
jgi:hypothetical protein